MTGSTVAAPGTTVTLGTLHNGRVPTGPTLVDIVIDRGVIVGVQPARVTPAAPPYVDLNGAGVLPAFVDPHIHLDKAYLLGRIRATGLPYRTVAEAMAATAALRPTLSRADIIERSERALGQLFAAGVSAARVHVEVEPILGLLGVEAHLELRARWAPMIELQLVAFPQNGIGSNRQVPDLLDEAMRMGCDVVGGCPYADEDQVAHVGEVFTIAERWGAPVDFHADFSDDPAQRSVDVIIDQTTARGMQHKVTVGHVTTLAAMRPEDARARADALAIAGIHVVALPATDIYLGGRTGPTERPGSLAPITLLAHRGVNVALGINNIQNAFTPLGRPSPLSVAWLAGLACHLGEEVDHRWLVDAVTTNPARILGKDVWGATVGAPADLAIVDTDDLEAVVASGATVMAVMHAGQLRIAARPQLSVGSRSDEWPE